MLFLLGMQGPIGEFVGETVVIPLFLRVLPGQVPDHSLVEDGVLHLERTRFYPIIYSKAGTRHDEKLVEQLSRPALRDERERQLAASWTPDFSTLETYQASVSANRERLRGYLGELHLSNRARVIQKQAVDFPPNECAVAIEASHVVVQSRAPHLHFEAYILSPQPANQNGWAVVAIHGHDSSPETLVGLEREDYARRMASRLACQGFVVLAPAVTSNERINNQANAYAHLYGYTIYGMMTQFIQSSLDVLEQEAPGRQAGVYGISNGALLALLSSAVDERLEFVVAEGILSNFYAAHLLPQAPAHNRKEYFFYQSGPFWTEFDIAELAYLSAPKLMIFTVGDEDAVTKQWWEAWRKIEIVYGELGAEDQLALIPFHGRHELAENHAIDLLQRKLMGNDE
jgi:hypothetical protein